MIYLILNIIACIEGNIILYIEYLFFVKFKKFGFLLFLCHCHLSIFNRSHWKKIWIIFKIKLYVGGGVSFVFVWTFDGGFGPVFVIFVAEDCWYCGFILF